MANVDKRRLMEVTALLGHTVIMTEPYKMKRKHTVTNKMNRGIIFGVNKDISDEEMTMSIGLKAERIIKKKFGNTIHTEQMIVYCEGDLPPFVTCGWKRFRVSLYIPEPVRCYRCQQYGHKAQFCRAKQIKCSICSGPHKTKACTIQTTHRQDKTAICPNCGGNHPASYRGCPAFKQEQEIKKVQITGKISYAEAARKCRNQDADKTHTLPDNENKKAMEHQATHTNQPERPPSGECKSKVNLGTNTEEIQANQAQDERRGTEYISKKLVNRYVHNTLKVLKTEESKEDMIKKICIILKKLMATTETKPKLQTDTDMNRQAARVNHDENLIQHE